MINKLYVYLLSGIREHIIAESKCICGVKTLTDDLIPNHTLRSTIINMLGTRATSSGSGTTTHRSSLGSNLDPILESHAPSAASLRDVKQSTDLQLSAASPHGLKVVTEGDLVNQPLQKLAANVDIMSEDEGNSTEVSAETLATAEVIEVKDGSELASKVTTALGALENNARLDQPNNKQKKAESAKNVQPNNLHYGYDIPFDPAYYNPFIGGYPWVTEPYMYGSLGMPYGGYTMDPYGVNSFNSMAPQALAVQGYPASYQRYVLPSILSLECSFFAEL